jgi:hypothetical protein
MVRSLEKTMTNYLRPLRYLPLYSLVVFCLSASARAADRLVPSEYPTIQAAVDVADEGDRIVLASGTYSGAGNRDVNLGTKNLTITSATGLVNSCVIDCQQAGRAFLIAGGQASATVIHGLTIRNGHAPSGSTDPTEGSGGGIAISGSSPTVSSCTFIGNTADVYGGGMFIVASQGAMVTDCSFYQNTAKSSGGGMAVIASAVSASGVTFNRNSSLFGGGLFIGTARMILTNGAFNGNTATREGGAIWVTQSSGGVTIANGTFSTNQAPEGGALSVSDGSVATVTNSLFWGDTAPAGPEILAEDSSVTVSSSDVQGGLPSGVTDGGGNIASDPLFVRAPRTNGSEDDGDLRLQSGSPTIDTGNSASVPSGITLDRLGNPRISGLRVDMGAYELPISAGVDLQVTAQLRRDKTNNQVVIELTLTNQGLSTATGVTLTGATLAGQSPLRGLPTTPQSLAMRQSVTLILPFVNQTAGQRTVLKLTGQYTGGTFGGTCRATIP